MSAIAMTNREKAQQPRGRSFYCFGCDRDAVWTGSKCRTCGYFNGNVRRKPTKRNVIAEGELD